MGTAAGTEASLAERVAFNDRFRLKLDGTGRVALPAAVKGAFGDRALLRAHRHEYLNLWTPAVFDQVVQRFSASGPGTVLGPRARKRLHMSVTQVAIDKQSRFVIPPELRDRVGLGERIVLAGAGETIEIWSADAFESEEATLDEVDLFFDGFEGL